MSDKRIKYYNFSVNKGGIILVKKYKDRVNTAIRIANHYRKNWDCLLWIAPQNYLDMNDYRKDIKIKFAKIKKEMKIVSFEDISIKDQLYLSLNELVSKKQVFCIIDESLNIKNMSSERAKRLFLLRNNFEYKLLLSKNIMYRELADIYNIMRFINPLVFNMTKTQFLHHYMPFYTDDFQISKRWSNPKLEKIAISLLRPYILVCDMSDNSKINYHNFSFELTREEQEAYKEDKVAFLKEKNKVAFLQVIQRFQYFYTICSNKVKMLIKILKRLSKNKKK